MKKYQVWMGGYAATGDHAPAEFCGEYDAESFVEACAAWVNEDKKERKKYFNPNNSIFSPPRPTYWGCSFYDNEADARETFG